MNIRDAYYDNAKFLLIFLVVFGHFIQSFIDESKLIYTLYTTIYLFHMPAFILISGYFARGFRKKGYLAKITKKLIGPYLIFQGIYSIYYFVIRGWEPTELDPLNPQWSLWFLVSLFFWNLMLFLFTKFKSSYAILISFGLGITVGYLDIVSNYLSLSRTIVFFPLFLLGYYFKKEHFETLRNKKVKLPAFVLLIIITAAFYILPEFDYKWLFGSKPYHAFDQTGLYGGIVRLGIYSLTLIATFSFLALVPRKNLFFTKWGASSIYIYLLHGFVVQYFRHSPFVEYVKDSEQIFVMLVVSMMITAICSSSWMKALAQPMIELKFTTLRNMVLNTESKTQSSSYWNKG
ncbi:acyltransferase family protein [Cytobacillus sp. FJAT-54145]|uniref:Acyltransferase family protein n=1 Tax=Cytobacillus spartinae TaxID=3299023 RepID=A0ABW6KIY4_9BACI